MSLQVVDTSMLDEYRASLGPEIVNDLIETYIADATDRLNSLLRLYQEGQTDALGKEAHAMKGAAANLGVQIVADLAKHLQTACEANDEAEISSLVPKMQTEVERALSELKGMLS